MRMTCGFLSDWRCTKTREILWLASKQALTDLVFVAEARGTFTCGGILPAVTLLSAARGASGTAKQNSVAVGTTQQGVLPPSHNKGPI